MKRLAAAPLLLCLSACFLLPKTSSTSDAGTDGGAARDAAVAEAQAPDASVSGCATDPGTGVTLCTAIARCPGIEVDHDRFPFCGIRPLGSGFDLACWCDGYVCPMGAPSTCSELAQLLDSQFEAQICAQVNEGRCSRPDGSGATTSTNRPEGLACDPECIRQCGGGGACRFACGCAS